jgi:hypothetical protein
VNNYLLNTLVTHSYTLLQLQLQCYLGLSLRLLVPPWVGHGWSLFFGFNSRIVCPTGSALVAWEIGNSKLGIIFCCSDFGVFDTSFDHFGFFSSNLNQKSASRCQQTLFSAPACRWLASFYAEHTQPLPYSVRPCPPPFKARCCAFFHSICESFCGLVKNRAEGRNHGSGYSYPAAGGSMCNLTILFC